MICLHLCEPLRIYLKRHLCIGRCTYIYIYTYKHEYVHGHAHMSNIVMYVFICYISMCTYIDIYEKI